MNDQVMREIDEDMRRERMRQLWLRYRKPALIALVLLVAITAGNSIYADYKSKKAGEAMLELDAGIQKLQGGETKQASEDFAALAKKSDGELHDIARLWQARAEALSNNADDAIKTLNDVAAKPAGGDLIWRDMACLRLLAAGADAPSACGEVTDSPLKPQRLEWRAATLWEQGKTAEARTLLNDVANDASAAPSQRERAARLLRALPEKAA